MISHESISQPEIFLHPFIRLKLDEETFFTNQFINLKLDAATTAITSTAILGTTATGSLTVLGSTTLGAMSIAATSTLAAQTSISAINNQGNLHQIGSDITTKESLQAVAISALAAGLMSGASNAAGLTQTTNAASQTNTTLTTNITNASNVTTTASTTSRLISNLNLALQKAAIGTTSATIANSIVTGNSIDEVIQNQGEKQIILNAALTALGEVGAKEIGIAAHSFKTDSAGNILTNASGEQLHQISKSTQLTLHGALGCGLSSAMGGDCASGAAAGVIGEYAADSAYKNGTLGADGKPLGLSRENSILIGQSSGALAALATSIATGQDDEETARNVMIGNFVGFNAASNNATDPFGIELSASEKDEKKFEEAKEKLSAYTKQVGKDVETADKAWKAVVAAYQLEYEIEKSTPRFLSPMEVNRQIEAARGSPQTIYQSYQATYKSGSEVNGVLSPLALNVGIGNVPLKDGRLDVSKVGQPISFSDLMNQKLISVFANEGGVISHFGNFMFPGANDMSLTHDNWVQNTQFIQDHSLANPATILPAYIYNSYGLIGKPINMMIDSIKSEQPKP